MVAVYMVNVHLAYIDPDEITRGAFQNNDLTIRLLKVTKLFQVGLLFLSQPSRPLWRYEPFSVTGATEGLILITSRPFLLVLVTDDTYTSDLR